MKKFLATMLALVMALTLCATAWAEGGTATDEVTVTNESELENALNAVQANGTAIINLSGVTYDFNNLFTNCNDPHEAEISDGKNITFSNGTFTFNNLTETSKDAFFHINGATVTFNNVNFSGASYNSAFGVIYAHNNGKVTLDTCAFNLSEETSTRGGVLKGESAAGATFNVKNCTFDLTNTVRVFGNLTLAMEDSRVTSTISGKTGAFANHAFRNVYGSIKNSVISTTGHETGIKNTENSELTISGSNITLSNSTSADISLSEGAAIKTDATTVLTYSTEKTEGIVTLTLVLDDETTTMIPVASGSTVNLADYTSTRTGYTFGTWVNEDDGKTYSGEIKLESNLTLNATWNSNVYKINYELDGGTNADSNPATYTYGEGVDSFAAPTKAGFNFNGWVDGNGNAVTTIAKDATGDVTLYAQWTAKPHRVIKNVTTDTTETKAESPKTFDAGIAVYGVMALTSALGMGYIGKKKF